MRTSFLQLSLPFVIGLAIHYAVFYFFPTLTFELAFIYHFVFLLISLSSNYVFALIKDPAIKTPTLLLENGLRLIAVLTVSIVILSKNKGLDNSVFFFNLFALYLYYTSFELKFIIRTLRPNSESTQKQDAKRS